MKEAYYREDLAFIHDVGHADFALESAPGIISILRQAGMTRGLVVDLGCGSGILASELIKAGYDVMGIDISASMINIARRRAPQADFRVGSLFKESIPTCVAVTSIGECLNYLFDSSAEEIRVQSVFRRIYGSLQPGCLFIFDVDEPGQAHGQRPIKTFSEGEDWLVVVEKVEHQGTLTRRIVSFRKVGDHYRREEEVHRQRLFGSMEIAKELREIGFRVRTMRSYGDYHLPKAHVAFVARKSV